MIEDTIGKIESRIQAAEAIKDDQRRRELLGLLTEKQGALALLLMNGLTPADAARTLGISPAAVAQTMKRMRERLRTMRSE